MEGRLRRNGQNRPRTDVINYKRPLHPMGLGSSGLFMPGAFRAVVSTSSVSEFSGERFVVIDPLVHVGDGKLGFIDAGDNL